MSSTKNILSTLADNPALMDAVKLLVTKQFEAMPDLSKNPSDELLGQFLRAHVTGLKAIDDAWKELAQYKTTPDKEQRVNPAR